MAAAATSGIWWLGTQSALAQASIRKNKEDGNVLVVVFLRGGADSLNMIAPYGEDDYYKLRPSLALKSPKSSSAGKLLDLDGFFGLNSALAPWENLFKEGKLAGIHAIGSGDRTHSHFEAMNTMERGWQDQTDKIGGGWLARHLNSTEGSGSPLRGISISPVLPDSLLGATHAQAVTSMSEYQLRTDDRNLRDAIRNVYQNANDPMAIAGHDTWSVLDSLNGVDPKNYKPDHSSTYPETPLGTAFKEVAFLIKQDLGLEVACLDAGGWDTHVTQGTTDGWMFGLLQDLALSSTAFLKDLGSLGSKTTVIIQTEFGRRVQENQSLGTDHGSGGCMFALGAGVNGGKIYGNWPTLVPNQLSGPGDLRVTTDYRAVLKEVTEKRLLNPNSAEVFPGFKSPSLNIFKT